MLCVVSQEGCKTYPIEYFRLQFDENYKVHSVVGFARYNLNDNELVVLGRYTDYKQAIKVFGEMNYLDNDLFYLTKTKRFYYMPKNLEGDKEVPVWIIYWDLVLPAELKDEFKWVLGERNYIKDHGVYIENKTDIHDNGIFIPEPKEGVRV